MTAVGKILVFFNLIFSLVVGAFVVTVYISQTHWVAEYNDLKRRYEVADASNAAYQAELKKANDYTQSFSDKYLANAKLEKQANFKADDSLEVKLKKIMDTVDAALADAAAQKAAADQATAEKTAAQKKIDAGDAALKSAQAEVAKRQTESEVTRTALKAETDSNLKYVQQIGQEHDQMVGWKIRAESAELRKNELEKENDRLARDNQKLITNGGKLTVAPKRDSVNPPLDSVEGLVREVGPTGLVRLTIGSDAGLAKGNTLEVYRLNTQVPDQSKYLGRIKIREVTPTEAVGEPMGRPSAPLQVGDQVSSRILGG